MGRLVIVSGPPGAGKSTVSQRLAQRTTAALAMHMHTDDMYAYIRKGFVPPWMPESRDQNVALMPDEATTVGRATARIAPGAMRDAGVVQQMWRALAVDAVEDRHRIDTTSQSPGETAEAILAGLRDGRFNLA